MKSLGLGSLWGINPHLAITTLLARPSLKPHNFLARMPKNGKPVNGEPLLPHPCCKGSFLIPGGRPRHRRNCVVLILTIWLQKTIIKAHHFSECATPSHLQIGCWLSGAVHIEPWAQVSHFIWTSSAILGRRNHALISPSICSLPKAPKSCCVDLRATGQPF